MLQVLQVLQVPQVLPEVSEPRVLMARLVPLDLMVRVGQREPLDSMGPPVRVGLPAPQDQLERPVMQAAMGPPGRQE